MVNQARFNKLYYDPYNRILYAVPHRNGTNTFDDLVEQRGFIPYQTDLHFLQHQKRPQYIYVILRNPLLRFYSWFDSFYSADHFDEFSVLSSILKKYDHTSEKWAEEFDFLRNIDPHTTNQEVMFFYNSQFYNSAEHPVQFLRNNDLSYWFNLPLYQITPPTTTLPFVERYFQREMQWYNRQLKLCVSKTKSPYNTLTTK